ncbi:hypothetical protein SHIRM173S_09623 [Streptomyces hirsutus]
MLAILSWLSGRGPGWDQASQAESGEKVSPETSPSALRSTSRTSPVSRSTSRTRPSCEATAARLPSGDIASPRTRPSCPAASRRGVAPGARPVAGANSRASSPSASVTHTTHSSPSARKVRGRRARTPGVAARARAGPDRWVTQWTAPRTQTALPRAVWSGAAEPNEQGRVHRERLEVDALAAEPDVERAGLGPVQVVEEPASSPALA